MIRRVLIANRGEIALRIVRACRELDIESVAVYSDADARCATRRRRRSGDSNRTGAGARQLSQHRRASSPPPQDTGADAMHPGYGFLSQNPAFARACDRARPRLRRPAGRSARADGIEDRRAAADDRRRRARRPRRDARRSVRPGVGRRGRARWLPRHAETVGGRRRHRHEGAALRRRSAARRSPRRDARPARPSATTRSTSSD